MRSARRNIGERSANPSSSTAEGRADEAVSHSRWRHSDWAEGFQELIRYLQERLRHGRQVVFIDELPWIASRRSGFLPAFEHFWNSWGSRQNNLIVVICGSAASWMIAKVLHQKGGLHNRVTRTMPLQPFNWQETEAFLRLRGIQLDRRQIMQIAWRGGWMQIHATPAWYARSGYAFENLCLQKISAIKKALGIAECRRKHRRGVMRQ